MCVNAKRSSTKVKTTTYHFLFYFCSKNPDRGLGFANISILVSKRQFFLCFCIGTSRNTLARTIMKASANDVRRQKAWDRNFKGSDKSRTSGYISILWPNRLQAHIIIECHPPPQKIIFSYPPGQFDMGPGFTWVPSLGPGFTDSHIY